MTEKYQVNSVIMSKKVS